jgi:hypothetical protein
MLALVSLGAASIAGILDPQTQGHVKNVWQKTFQAVTDNTAPAMLRSAPPALAQNTTPVPVPPAETANGTVVGSAATRNPPAAPALLPRYASPARVLPNVDKAAATNMVFTRPRFAFPALRANATPVPPASVATVAGAASSLDSAVISPASVAAASYPPVTTPKPLAATALLPHRTGLQSEAVYTDKTSAAYTRFKSFVDSNVTSNGASYGFRASDATIMYELSPEAKYCTLAVNLTERQVADAEARIAARQNPAVAGDSYLEAGGMIGDVAATYHTCASFLSDSQRTRWAAYATQTIWNIWNYNNAKWGNRSAPWSGWSTSNPGNNYYYSFLGANMSWALVSDNNTWLNLRTVKLPALQAYFAQLPGGGSSEGTGYGTSHMRLFSLYRLWRDGTGVDLANANSHVTDSIFYWVHATVPTMDRFAPIGDQARVSIPEMFDYQRRLVLEARQVSNNALARNQATWWLNNISVPRMTQGFDYRYDLLPAGTTPVAPTDLLYHAKGVGHLFARTGWDRNAMWVAIVAGPYTESHAHQDQGSFTLFAGDWLAVTANIWSRSGINQGTDVHNLVRFVRNGSVASQCVSTTRASTMAVTPGSGGAFTATANLTPAFCNNNAVTSWQRQFTFGGRKLTIRDQFAITSGTTATFQINVPVQPTCSSNEATAGKLRVRVLEPSNATFSLCGPGVYVNDGARYRIDINGGTTGYLVELSEVP